MTLRILLKKYIADKFKTAALNMRQSFIILQQRVFADLRLWNRRNIMIEAKATMKGKSNHGDCDNYCGSITVFDYCGGLFRVQNGLLVPQRQSERHTQPANRRAV